MIGCARWAKVSFQPTFSDVRFQPSDQFHAGCTNSADILFSPQGQKITKFTLVLYYNPEKLEILRVLPTVNTKNVTSKIEYNKIILEVTNPTFSSSNEAKSFFQLNFKSSALEPQSLILGTGSSASTSSKTYPLDGSFDLQFARVVECDPDVIPPSLSLIYPKDSEQKIGLDQYFIFDIKDIGKWIDKRSVIINFDGDEYFYGSENLKRNGNYLTFYPSKWIPINKSLDLKILVADLQSYGGANKTESSYTFKSATWIVLNKKITPMMFRRITQEAEKISASSGECALLANFYTTTEVPYQNALKSILQKVGCELSSLDASLEEAALASGSTMNTQQKQYTNISVFATLGWILFFVTFALKIHYLLSYKKHKRISEKLKQN